MPTSGNTKKKTRRLRFIATPRESYPYIRQAAGRSSVAPASPPATRKPSNRWVTPDSKNRASLQRSLQPINQLLHILFTQRLQQSPSDRHKPSKDLRLPLPDDFGPAIHGREIESCRE